MAGRPITCPKSSGNTDIIAENKEVDSIEAPRSKLQGISILQEINMIVFAR